MAAPGSTESAAEQLAEQLADPSLMTATQLRAAFGGRAAEVTGVLFQHTARHPIQHQLQHLGTAQPHDMPCLT